MMAARSTSAALGEAPFDEIDDRPGQSFVEHVLLPIANGAADTEPVPGEDQLDAWKVLRMPDRHGSEAQETSLSGPHDRHGAAPVALERRVDADEVVELKAFDQRTSLVLCGHSALRIRAAVSSAEAAFAASVSITNEASNDPA